MNPPALVTNTRRLELYIRSSVYLLLVLEPFVGVAGMPGVPLGITISVALVQTAVNLTVCRWSLNATRTGESLTSEARTRVLLVAWIALSAAVLAAVVIMIEPVIEDPTTFTRYWLVVVTALVGPVCAVAALIPPRWLLVPCAAVVAVGFVVLRFRMRLDLPTTVGVLATLALVGTFFVYSFWLSGWMLRVVWALEDARTTSAALAIAEERLRISRDLHDLFGRTLAAVAVKSELAAELLRRGRPEAAESEISAVRGIADESGREVREVVRGYRATDLATELAGSRSLVESAGIRCVVKIEDVPNLSPGVQETLGWLLREAVTNLIRHSDATECVITVQGPDPVRLAVTNNGVTAAESDGGKGGSGLIGMAERAAAVGGKVRTSTMGDHFTVTAEVSS